MDQLTSSISQLQVHCTSQFSSEIIPDDIDVFEEMDCGVGDTIVFTSATIQKSSISLVCDDKVTDNAISDYDYVCKNLDENIIVSIEDNSNNHVPCEIYEEASVVLNVDDNVSVLRADFVENLERQ